MTLSKVEKKNNGRAITVLVIGLLIASFLMFNAGQSFGAAILYIVLGVLTIFGYLVWDKF